MSVHISESLYEDLKLRSESTKEKIVKDVNKMLLSQAKRYLRRELSQQEIEFIHQKTNKLFDNLGS